MKILLVDDDTLVLRSLTRLLVRRGHLVRAHVSQAAAMADARDWADVGLFDVDMPEGTGIELAARIRCERPTFGVVLHSGNPAVAAASGLPFVAKPAAVEAIDRALVGAVEPLR